MCICILYTIFAIFKLPEVTMMMGGFAGREGVHIDAYSYLLETLGMPEATYKEFLLYEEMKDKQDYIKKFSDSRLYFR